MTGTGLRKSRVFLRKSNEVPPKAVAFGIAEYTFFTAPYLEITDYSFINEENSGNVRGLK